MLSSLTCLLLLSVAPAQKSDLEIVNTRITWGYLGATREKTGGMPGETVHFAFDIKGMTNDAGGRVAYTLLMEVFNQKGEKVFHIGPRDAVARNFLGGDITPCCAHMKVPLDAPPGTVSLRVTIKDKLSKKKAIFESKGKIVPVEFRLVNVGTFADSAGKVPSSAVGAIGESLYVAFSTVGFARDPKTSKPSIKMSLQIFDDKGKPTLTKPIQGTVSEAEKGAKMLEPLTVGFTLNRIGRFTVELTAVDQVAGKTSKVRVPFVVVQSP